MDERQRGMDAEERAWQHLMAHGARLLQRNFRSRRGEIDLIVQDRDSVVFVEVRYRTNPNYGSGAESVDLRKQSRLIACAQHYLQVNPDTAHMPCRFDVIAINGSDGSLTWIRNAFDSSN
jgi:putative endonuclease